MSEIDDLMLSELIIVLLLIIIEKINFSRRTKPSKTESNMYRFTNFHHYNRIIQKEKIIKRYYLKVLGSSFCSRLKS